MAKEMSELITFILGLHIFLCDSLLISRLFALQKRFLLRYANHQGPHWNEIFHLKRNEDEITFVVAKERQAREPLHGRLFAYFYKRHRLNGKKIEFHCGKLSNTQIIFWTPSLMMCLPSLPLNRTFVINRKFIGE